MNKVLICADLKQKLFEPGRARVNPLNELFDWFLWFICVRVLIFVVCVSIMCFSYFWGSLVDFIKRARGQTGGFNGA